MSSARRFIRAVGLEGLAAVLAPILDVTTESSGSIGYSSYVSWAILELSATLDPRGLIAPNARVDGSLELQIRAWEDAEQWPLEQRQKLLDSVAPVRQAPAQWLIAQRGFNSQDVQVAADHWVHRWLDERFEFIKDNLLGDSPN